MTTVTIDIESRQVIGYLQQAPARINRAMRAAMEDATVLIHRQMQTYPRNVPVARTSAPTRYGRHGFAHLSADKAMILLARLSAVATQRHTIGWYKTQTAKRLCIGDAGLTRRKRCSGARRRRFSATLTGDYVRSSDANTGQGVPCKNGLTFSTS